MNENESQVREVEVSIEKANEQIDLSQRLKRLEKNKDFKVLIVDGLLREGAINQVMLLGSPQLHGSGPGADTARVGIKARIAMIGELYNFFRYIHIEGDSARAAMADYEECHDELLQEQLAED